MRFLFLFFCCVFCGALTACASTPRTPINNIKIIAQLGANQNVATAIDIVFVYDTTSTSMLPKSGPDWFSNKAALMSGLATNIDVVSLQIPPATTLTVPLPDRYSHAVAVYSSANYITAGGQPVGNLTPYETMMIQLTPDNVIYRGS